MSGVTVHSKLACLGSVVPGRPDTSKVLLIKSVIASLYKYTACMGWTKPPLPPTLYEVCETRGNYLYLAKEVALSILIPLGNKKKLDVALVVALIHW